MTVNLPREAASEVHREAAETPYRVNSRVKPTRLPEAQRQDFFLSIFKGNTISFLLSKLEMVRVVDLAPSFSA